MPFNDLIDNYIEIFNEIFDISFKDVWTMSNWPVINVEAEDERERLSATHRPVPLPAYDVDGELISPARCRESLAGAIVRVSFTLTHWFISSGSNDDRSSMNSFVADVHSIRQLVTPLSSKLTPKKRKTAQRDPDDKFISKKMSKKISKV